MLRTFWFYRSTACRKPRGPWRADRTLARRDAVSAGLGAIDENGCFYDLVPGEMQAIELPVHLLREALALVERRAAA